LNIPNVPKKHNIQKKNKAFKKSRKFKKTPTQQIPENSKNKQNRHKKKEMEWSGMFWNFI